MDLPAAKAEAAAMLPVLDALTADQRHYYAIQQKTSPCRPHLHREVFLRFRKALLRSAYSTMMLLPVISAGTGRPI